MDDTESAHWLKKNNADFLINLFFIWTFYKIPDKMENTVLVETRMRTNNIVFLNVRNSNRLLYVLQIDTYFYETTKGYNF